MKEYLVINFKDALLFRTHNNTKDKAFHGGFIPRIKNKEAADIRYDRKLIPQFVEPITYHQVSGLLHVLFGERPVPFFGNVSYKRVQHLVEKARESFIKVNVPTYKNKKGETRIIKETISASKMFNNSWQKGVNPNWYFISQTVPGAFSKLIDELSKIVPEPFSMSWEDFLKAWHASGKNLKKEKICELISDSKKSFKNSGLSKVLRGDESGYNGLVMKSKQLVNSGPEDASIRLSGTILVPISEADKQVLRDKSPGVATILDGGIACIYGIVAENKMNEYNKNEFRMLQEVGEELELPIKPKTE